jgi:hypothetical protein
MKTSEKPERRPVGRPRGEHSALHLAERYGISEKSAMKLMGMDERLVPLIIPGIKRCSAAQKRK